MARGATGTTKSGKTGPKARSGMVSGATVKDPQPVDRHVGSRVRMRRMMVGMSQEKLGQACGITFQQVQKYEKGTNRMGASRLHQISRVLDVPVEFFYEGAPSEEGTGASAGGRSECAFDDGVSGHLRRAGTGQGVYGSQRQEGSAVASLISPGLWPLARSETGLYSV